MGDTKNNNTYGTIRDNWHTVYNVFRNNKQPNQNSIVSLYQTTFCIFNSDRLCKLQVIHSYRNYHLVVYLNILNEKITLLVGYPHICCKKLLLTQNSHFFCIYCINNQPSRQTGSENCIIVFSISLFLQSFPQKGRNNRKWCAS